MLAQLDPVGRRSPHDIGAAAPESGRHGGGASDYRPLHSRAARIARFGPAVDQDGRLTPLGASSQMKNRASRPLGGSDFFLQHHQPLQHRFGPGRTARNVDIDRQDLIYALDDAVNIIHPAAVGAGTHGNDPLGFRHLFVEAQDDRRNFLEDGTGGNQQIGLARRGAQHFGAEPGHVVPGGKGRGFFHKTAGKPEKHGPEAVLARPVDHQIGGAEQTVAHRAL